MKRAVTAQQMRLVEAEAAERFQVSAAALMERAGAALADEAAKLAGPAGRFFVLCGRGNNGGDGLVAARKLAQRGREVRVELLGDPEALRGDARRSFEALVAAGVRPGEVRQPGASLLGDVVIDALLGTGLSRAPDPLYAEAIARIRSFQALGAKVVAADLPSGLETDTGRVHAHCVRADVTVAFGYAKVGQLIEPGASVCGRLEVVEIGLPPELEPAPLPVFLLEEQDARTRLPGRASDSHKGTYGHLLVVAGSDGRSGAAALAARAALRGGAGLVTLAARRGALEAALAHTPEAMGIALPGEGPLGHRDLEALVAAAEGKSALVIGPGIPRGEDTGELLGDLLEHVAAPAVLDADALNAVGADLSILSRAQGPLILTPHPGEAARLLGRATSEIQRERVEAARAVAEQRRATVILKGARSLIATPDSAVYVNPTGNPGMATAGMGDVLAGLVGALVAQGLPPLDAALCATYAHGLAGDLAAARTGQLGLMASDVLEALCEVWRRWGR